MEGELEVAKGNLEDTLEVRAIAPRQNIFLLVSRINVLYYRVILTYYPY